MSEAVTTLIKRSIAFADWAAGEGICPAGYEDEDSHSRNPDEFLLAYSIDTNDEDWDTLADRISAWVERLQIDASNHAADAEMVRRERDAALRENARLREALEKIAKAETMVFDGELQDLTMQWLDDEEMSAIARAALAGGNDAS